MAAFSAEVNQKYEEWLSLDKVLILLDISTISIILYYLDIE